MTAMQARASLWRHRDFLKLWSGQSISLVGSQITLLAMPLAAIMLLDASPFELGLLTGAEFLPFLLIGLPAGVWVDRWPRRTVMITADLGRAGLLLLVPAAYSLDVLHLWVLYAAAFLTGALTVFFDVAYQSYLPSLVGEKHLVEGNTKLEFSDSSAQLAGPSLAGFMVQGLGAALTLLIDAVSYLFSAFALLFIRSREDWAAKRAETRADLIGDIKVGLRLVFGNPSLRSIAACTALSNLFGLGGAVQALLALYTTTQLGMSPGQLGVTMAIGNVGALLGVLCSRKLVGHLGLGPTMIVSILFTSASVLLLPLATKESAQVVTALAVGLAGAGSTVYNVNQISLRQILTAPHMRGRMNATMRFCVWGTIPVGAFLGGSLGSLIGVRQTLWAVSVAGLLAAVPLLVSPVRSLRRMPEPEPEPEPEPAETRGGSDSASSKASPTVDLQEPPS